MIPRFITQKVVEQLVTRHKVNLIFGARQVGKTTLLHEAEQQLTQSGRRVRYLDCDIYEERQAINTTARASLDRVVQGCDILMIDEAQNLDNPGLTIKILHDVYPDLGVIATGSSSFDLRNRISNALTGRYIDFNLYPLSLGEILSSMPIGSDQALRKPYADNLLGDLLLYGTYPEIFTEGNPTFRKEQLARLVESYLFKDIFTFERIQRSQAIVDLARALAYQIGNLISESELASRLKIDRKTVLHYLEIMEKAYVIVRLTPYSNYPRQEIGKQSKIYFTDLGIRNALIGDFNSLAVRPDVGALWENFIILERLKQCANRSQAVQAHFWRSYNGAEVDYLEVEGSSVKGYEIKYGASALRHSIAAFEQPYHTIVELINRDTYLEFLGI